MTFLISRINDGITRHHGREQIFVARYKDTHMTLSAIARKLDISRPKAELILPPPDIICAFGNKTRLWSRETIDKLIAEKATAA